MWRISFWLFFSIGYIIINNSIKADFNPYRPNRLHFHISIHAPRAGSDDCIRILADLAGVFQSTLPVRGATGKTVFLTREEAISIHAPRAGSDS